MRTLKDRVAVITGASIGIGRAVAIALAREGVRTILVARGQSGLEETRDRIVSEGGSATIVRADLASPDDIKSLVAVVEQQYTAVDILWNGAFGWIDGPLEENTIDDLVSFLDGSVRGSLLLTKALLPLLDRSASPHIINVSADWEFPALSGLTAFVAAKRALAGMGIALQKEKAGRLRVTNLHPADVASKESDIDESVHDVLSKNEKHMIPLSEIAALVVFVLKLEGTIVHQLNIKPLDQEVGMTFL